MPGNLIWLLLILLTKLHIVHTELIFAAEHQRGGGREKSPRTFHNWSHSRGQNIGREVSDVGGDFPARQKLSHLVAEYVAVVLEEAVFVAAAQQGSRDRR